MTMAKASTKRPYPLAWVSTIFASERRRWVDNYTLPLLLAQGKFSLNVVRAATTVDCRTRDRNAFESSLNQVLKAGDPDASVRLHNLIAKRRARRWLVEEPLSRHCGF
jgi:hypothetical protein